MNTLEAFSGFSVNDSAKAKDFYTNILSLELADDKMGLRFKLPGGGVIFIYEKPDHQPADYTMLNFVVEDIDAAVDELSGKGVKFERYPDMPAPQDDKGIMRGDGQHGPSIAWLKDPAGNIISVIEGGK